MGKKKIVLFSIGVVLLMGIMCLLLYEPLMDMIASIEVWKSSIEDHYILGSIGIIITMMLQVVFVFLPGEVIEVMAGYLFGSFMGMVYCLIGSALGSIIIYKLVKKIGMPFIQKSIGIKKINEVSFLKKTNNLNLIVFIIFFIPGTPKDIITYFIPFTDMKLSSFLILSSIGRIPSIISSTIGGNALGMDQYLLCFIVFVFTGIISLIGLYVYRHRIVVLKESKKL